MAADSSSQALGRISLFSFAVDCLDILKQQRGLAYSSCFSVRKLFSPGASGEQNVYRNGSSHCIAANTSTVSL